MELPHELAIDPEEIEVSRLLTAWLYLAPEPGEVICLSAFGDWFCDRRGLGVYRLDLLEGSFSPVAPSREAFFALLRSESGADELLQAATVDALRAAGARRKRGQCYTYLVHPRLGAPVELSNIQLADHCAWQMFCAQLHRQLNAIPEDSVVTGIAADPTGEITAQHAPKGGEVASPSGGFRWFKSLWKHN